MCANRLDAIVVSGAAGVGKSTTGLALAHCLGASLLDLDSMTNPLIEAFIDRDLSDAEHSQKFQEIAARVRNERYECLTQVSLDCLRAGNSVVMVAPFTAELAEPLKWDTLSSRLQNWGAHAWLVWLYADHAVIQSRLRQRSEVRDHGLWLGKEGGDLSLANSVGPSSPHIAVNSERPVSDQVDFILGTLKCFSGRK